VGICSAGILLLSKIQRRFPIGILTKIAKECPQCKKRYLGFSNYCRHHKPAVALRGIEVRI
jgi:hypothetical protein